MKIGIDARLINETGIGRYIRNLITELMRLDTKNSYVVFLPTGADTWTMPNNRWEKRLCAVHWHTVKEQLLMPRIFLHEHLDLLHVPYFNVPIFYPKPFVVTIHDLTILHVATGKATTLPKPLYQLRRLGYQVVVRIGVRRARRVIAVSNYTKQDIVKNLGIHPEKIVVTYEGVDKQICVPSNAVSPVNSPYFLYVGNAYPHKNLEFLIKSFGIFVQTHPMYKLVLVGKNDFFYRKLRTWVYGLPYAKQVVFVEGVSDATLALYYTYAVAFVFPSLIEGFGLPALEAVSFHTPVLCSDIPVFHELFGNVPYYFSPHDEKNLSGVMEHLLTSGKKKQDEAEQSLLSQFEWHTMAKETLSLYQQSV